MTGEIERVIERVTRALASEDLVWALTGSAGHALQGADLEPKDVDVQTDERGAYRIAELLAEYRTRPVEHLTTELVRLHFGTLHVEGVNEVMGGVQTRSLVGSWTEP